MRLALFALIALLATVVIGACGGGESTDNSPDDRVTDPAKVPTADPIQNPVLFQIRGDEIFTASDSTRAPASSQTIVPLSYTVVEGDNCSLIASRLGIDVDDLLAANRTITSDCTNLHIGDVLRVPASAIGSSTPAPPPNSGSSGAEHTVSEGDTCAGIAQSFAVPVEALISLNGIDSECRNLQVGQVVTIP